MKKKQRLRLRAAAAILDGVQSRPTDPQRICFPAIDWKECCQLEEMIATATAKGWSVAAEHTKQQLRQSFRNLRCRLDEFGQHLDASNGRKLPLTLRSIYEDMGALEREFDDVAIDLANTTLIVVTAPVVLEDIRLGTFEIVLDWSMLDQSQSYEVIACDPNPAASSFDTTHPHVQSNQLCEGDGRAPIRSALDQGRLVDFFLLVQQILQTYNSSSAYVSLSDWHGVSCQDCGCSTDEDERCCCRKCEADVCGDCTVACLDCCESYCSDCLTSCPGCSDGYCKGCLECCTICNELFCKECLPDEICTTCIENCEDEEPEADFTGAAVHTLCVGEASVPA